ncbi:hypothetical protein Fcan01_28648 [Folsomia candida]|uniref:Uncharacterized protein n=1 Tax=Folsomia candida TaxID=158441 RepID=A0A226CX28_FOLCA|nr:hypothetical protein Fcan01_28648 [Folsomia candida]
MAHAHPKKPRTTTKIPVYPGYYTDGSDAKYAPHAQCIKVKNFCHKLIRSSCPKLEELTILNHHALDFPPLRDTIFPKLKRCVIDYTRIYGNGVLDLPLAISLLKIPGPLKTLKFLDLKFDIDISDELTTTFYKLLKKHSSTLEELCIHISWLYERPLEWKLPAFPVLKTLVLRNGYPVVESVKKVEMYQEGQEDREVTKGNIRARLLESFPNARNSTVPKYLGPCFDLRYNLFTLRKSDCFLKTFQESGANVPFSYFAILLTLLVHLHLFHRLDDWISYGGRNAVENSFELLDTRQVSKAGNSVVIDPSK